jgi:uncharacterized OB-fold protein
MVANVIGCAADEVKVGMPVSAEFHDIGGGISLPYFAPTGA